LDSQKVNHMMLFLSGTGLRYKENVIDLGAQTERRGDDGPLRDLLGGRYLSGYFVSRREEIGVS